MEQIYLTNEVAKQLDVSIATIRNYAKSLERAGYTFNTKKQARLWTDKEIDLIKQVQQFYSNNDYTLEQSFKYVVKRHTEGKEQAEQLLDSFTSLTPRGTPTTPQLDYLEGIQSDTKTLINMLSDLQGNIPNKDMLLELQGDNKKADELQKEIAHLQELLHRTEQERDTYKKELDHVKTLNIFNFSKWKRENSYHEKNDLK